MPGGGLGGEQPVPRHPLTEKTVGVSDCAILSKFVPETITLAGFGGLIESALRLVQIVAARAVGPHLGTSGFLSSFNPISAPSSILAVFSIIPAIGPVTVDYPARRTALLEPIEALRYE
jgi:ABC-type lipoprotein release transport system permease subunit